MTDEQILEILVELKREYRMREHAYPRWILEARLSQKEADQRQKRLLAAIKHFEGLHAVAPKQQGDFF